MKARALFNATRRERASIELSKIEVPSPGRIGKPVEIVDTSESRMLEILTIPGHFVILGSLPPELVIFFVQSV
jgi:hypothetical protein